MFDIVKRFFHPSTDRTAAGKAGSDHDVRVATCALLVEMARIDGTFTDAEMNAIIDLLRKRYGLDPEHADALVQEADRELKNSVDLWQFARLINEHYSIEKKIGIVEILWQLVYLDGRMDEFEHYLMGKLKHLLRLSQDQLIDAKLRVKKELGL